jgi:hypothetical protein
MVIRSLVALVLAVGVVQVVARAEKKRDWQMGKVLYLYKTNVSQDVVIGWETHTYFARKWLSWRFKPANLTVNGHVKFAIDKRTLFVIDEDGEEHRMEIMRKVLREESDQGKVPR